MNGNLKKMREKRNEIIAAMEAVVNAAAAEERSLTDDEITAYNGHREELTRIDATIAALENVRSAERNEEHQPEGDEKLTPEERSFVSFLRGEIRADVNTTKTNAGAVIPTTVADRIVEYVKNVSPIAEYATRYEGIGKITIAYEDDANALSASYVEDLESADATAQKLTSVSLEGYKIRVPVKVSQQLLDNSQVDLIAYLVRRIGDALAAKIEREFLIGTSGKVAGLAGGVKQTVTAASATAVTTDELIDVQDAVPDIYQANSIWIMHPKTRTAIRKLKDGENRYLLNLDLNTKWGYSLLGKPVYASDAMPEPAAGAKTIFYGDMSGLACIIRGLRVRVLNERFADVDAVGIFGFAEIDAKVENTQKISVLTMKSAT
nr:MAG TPA: major capsid protein [Caudoviricetes sp.]